MDSADCEGEVFSLESNLLDVESFFAVVISFDLFWIKSKI